MSEYSKLKKMLMPADGRPVSVKLVKVLVNGQEARAVGLGEVGVIDATRSGVNQVMLSSGQKIPLTKESGARLELEENGEVFRVIRDASGTEEVSIYQILQEGTPIDKRPPPADPGATAPQIVGAPADAEMRTPAPEVVTPPTSEGAETEVVASPVSEGAEPEEKTHRRNNKK